ncbi:MAG: trypsin-like serine protease [Bradymonadia bacterium]
MLRRTAFTVITALSLLPLGCVPADLEDEAYEADAGEWDESAEFETSEQAIEIGANDVSNAVRDAVVNVGGICTGTLIANNVVLTAMHCGFENRAYADGNWHDLPGPINVNFGPDRARPRHTAVATRVSTPTYVAAPWPEDIALLLLRDPVPAAIATPRPVLVDRPAGLNSTSVIYQVGYGGGRNRRSMTGRGYSDWTSVPPQLMNGFVYTADDRGPGIGDRDTNIEGGDSGGPMLFGSVTGPVMGDLSHWNPYGIATFGPGGGGRPSIRNWINGKAPQRPDFRITAIQRYGCTGSGGEPMVGITVKNEGTISARTRVDVFLARVAAPVVGDSSALNRLSDVLAPGGTQTLSFAVSRDYQARTVRVDAIADTLRGVTESNEDNNRNNASAAFEDCRFN